MTTPTKKRKKIRFIVADFETDPFLYDRKPEVFLSGVYDGEKVIQWWGKNAIPDFCEYLNQQKERLYIFFHNGGKFDFFFLPWPLENPIKIINGRIVSAKHGIHTLRDSLAFLPFAMEEYKKTEIDYAKFEASCRETHRKEISAYHADDLRNLHDLINAFIERFGLRLTIAGTAIKELNKYHEIERKGKSHDDKFREFYFGGRTECFETGTITGKWRIFDVVSMYPTAMANYDHPIGTDYEFTTDAKRILDDPRPGFITLEATSRGAFPLRGDNGKLEFPHTRAIYCVTLYEFRTAVKLGLATVHNIQGAYISRSNGRFSEFVKIFSDEKIKAKASGDRIGELFAKLMLNSAYGKFGANPENYYDYKFLLADAPFPGGDWEIFEDYGWFIIIRCPSPLREFSYYDVATAASITGAARSILLRAIHSAQRPIYCDTDSLVCESLAEPQGNKLGDWKLEATADRAIIIGRKLYVFTENGKIVKSAHKGIQLELKDYLAISKGNDYTYFRDAPTFKKDGSVTFINRQIKGIRQ